MGISEYEFKKVIKLARKVIPDFKYTRKMSKSDQKEAEAFYLPDSDLIYFREPKEYKSKHKFIRVVFHELAHWSMGRGLNRVPDISNNHSEVCELLEECIAEKVSKVFCQKLGYKYLRIHNDYIRSYRRKLYRSCSKEDYKYYKEYINKKVDEVVTFMLTYSIKLPQ